MAFDTFDPPVKPHVSSPRRKDDRVLEARFGDAYEQTAGDGINTVTEEADLIWPAVNGAAGDYIESFFDSHGKRTAFRYRIPGRAATNRYKFTSFERVGVNGDLDSIRAGIRQVFDIEE